MNILVTAGPTREPIDPVRFLSNRSTGRMGYAVAQAAAEAGHGVRLVSGPVSLAVPAGVACERINTAEEMRVAVGSAFEWCDALVMVAAVADWRPVRVAATKLKKRFMASGLDLERTVDILAGLGPRKGERILVGFAAETDDVVAEAQRKLQEKNLDLIVANDVSAPGSGFEVETNRVTFYTADGEVRPFPIEGKDVVARAIIDWIEGFAAGKSRE